MYPDLNSDKIHLSVDSAFPFSINSGKIKSFNYHSSVPVRDFHPTSYAKHKIYVLVKDYHNISLKSRFLNTTLQISHSDFLTL